MNDLRTQALRDRAAVNRKKSNGKGHWIFLLVIGILATMGGAGFIGVIWIIAAAVGLNSANKQEKKRRQMADVMQTPQQQAAAENRRRREEAAVSAQRRKEAGKKTAAQVECTNPEPHRHFDVPVRTGKKESYDTFIQTKRWPTPQERRMENMKHLYDAGLLTREEYNHELRRIRNGV